VDEVVIGVSFVWRLMAGSTGVAFVVVVPDMCEDGQVLAPVVKVMEKRPDPSENAYSGGDSAKIQYPNR
jgi:hypothetical protein